MKARDTPNECSSMIRRPQARSTRLPATMGRPTDTPVIEQVFETPDQHS
jgi:hypothetical protein